MYSDSDVEDFDDYASFDSSDDVSSADVVEQQIALREFNLSAGFQSYAWIFDDEDGFFRTHFAHLLPDHTALPDRWDSPKSPDCFHTISALLSAAAANTTSNGKEAASTGATAAAVPSTTGADAAVAAAGAYTPLLSDGKPSPASRFLCDNFGSCILIPVDKALNRAQLREAHKDVKVGVSSAGDGEGELDVVPGYRHTEAAGWALPITVDKEVLALLKVRHPGWRSPTPADVSLFTKPERSAVKGKTSAGAAAAAGVPPSKRSWTRHAAQLMRSKERFLSCVAAAGGWSEVIFVAVDVEAFAITAQSVPLPAEYAFEPVYWSRTRRAQHSRTNGAAKEARQDEDEQGEEKAVIDVKRNKGDGHTAATAAPLREKAVKPLHFFCHPGRLPEEEEPTILYTCLSTHLVPFRNATFLTHDYRTKARQVDTLLVRNARVVFINKGSVQSPTVMDLQALRWLYAAALWQQHRFRDAAVLTADAVENGLRDIPDAEDIHCFDVSVLEEAAAECSSRTAAERSGDAKPQEHKGSQRKPKPPQCCWYHTVVEDCEVMEEEVHCARRDAQVLAQRIRTALETERPGQAT